MNYEKLPKTISAEELLSTPLPPVKWIIPDLLPAGLALFAGPSKAGKSWLTLWLCLQVAQGKPMWGREIEPHTVLYLSLEDTFNRLQKRLLQLVGSEEAPEQLVMQTECGSIGQGLEEQLTSFLYQHPDTGLIVIDTLQKVRSNDQNNSMYASDYKEISALKALADKYNICILLIHHLRKQAADDPFQQIAGSNGLMGASDTSWVMQRKRMSQTASILVTGRDMDNKTLRLHEENCVWILDEEESTEQIVAKAVPSYLWKVADYIDSVGTWQGTATELLSAADIEGVLPHQLTRKIVEHFDTVFTPRGIRYETHRTSQARQMKFSHDGNDADDANDAEIDITQLFKWDISQTASSASLASQRSRKESKHMSLTLVRDKFTGKAHTTLLVAIDGLILLMAIFVFTIGGFKLAVSASREFSALPGSSVAAASAMGGCISPIEEENGYDPAYSAAANIASTPTGLLIPPTSAFIVYSTVAGGVSISTLFMAGYIPGILMGLC